MTRALTRTNLHSSRLIRILADLALLDSVEPGMALTEKLGLWVDYSDAITLSAALNVSAASPPRGATGARAGATVDLGDEFEKTRTTLVNSITKRSAPNVAKPRSDRSTPVPDLPVEVTTSYELYRRHYCAHQRDMYSAIQTLRAHVREVLAETSPALRQLAALDAALDTILCDRESKLLSSIPLLLERRFKQLRVANQQLPTNTKQADSQAIATHPGVWLTRFDHELETVLLAELDVRLQPALGLIEAFNNQTRKQR